MHKRISLLTALLVLICFQTVQAYPKNKVVSDYLTGLEAEAKKADPKFTGFSATEGKTFYLQKFSNQEKPLERNCASCHNDDPTKPAQHATTGKKIHPLAPATNHKRFTDVKKIEKWFKRNCKWVMDRECTAKEKGDFIEYMYTF